MLGPFAEFLRVSVELIEDIACMKISACGARTQARFNRPVAAAAQSSGLKPLLDRFETEVAGSPLQHVYVLKVGLTYFADRRKDPSRTCSSR